MVTDINIVLEIGSIINKLLNFYFNTPKSTIIQYFSYRRRIIKQVIKFKKYVQINKVEIFNHIKVQRDIEKTVNQIYIAYEKFLKHSNIKPLDKIINLNREEKRNFYGLKNESKMLDFLKSKLIEYKKDFYLILLNGSIGSRDYKIGWSDVDIFIILKKDTFQSKEKLHNIRIKILELNKIVKKYSIFQLHGIFISPKIQLDYFHNSILPLPCLFEGEIFFQQEKLKIRPIKSLQKEIDYFFTILNDAKSLYFKQKIKSLTIIEKIRYIHRIYSFPFTFLQCFGDFIYKRDSFEKLTEDYSFLFNNIKDFYDFFNSFYLNWNLKYLKTYEIRKFFSNIFNINSVNKYFRKFEKKIYKNINQFWKTVKNKKYLDQFDQFLNIAFNFLKKKEKFPSLIGRFPFEKKDFYNFCEKKIIKVFSKVKGVISIYKFGTITAVGNSDIDLCFIIDKKICKNDYINKILLSKFTKNEKYLIYQHSPLILNVKLFKNIHVIRPAKSLQLLYGETLTHNFIEYQTDFYFQLISLIEILCTINPLRNTRKDKDLNYIRHSLQLINAQKYIIELYIRICNHYNEIPKISILKFDQIIRSNQFYRQNMFNFSKEMLISFLKYCQPLLNSDILKIKGHISSILTKFELNFVPNNESIQQINQAYFIYDYKKLIKNKENSKYRNLCFIFNPIEFYYVFNNFINILKPNFLKKITDRKKILEEYINFTNSKNFRRLYAPFYCESKITNFSKIFSSRLLYIFKIRKAKTIFFIRKIYINLFNFRELIRYAILIYM